MRIIMSSFALLFLTIFSLPAYAQAAVGANCTIQWVQNTEADLAKYTVTGTLSGVTGVPGPVKILDIAKPATSTTCAAMGLQSGGTLSIQVEAVDVLGNRSPKSVVVTMLQDITGPAQPTGVTISPNP